MPYTTMDQVLLLRRSIPEYNLRHNSPAQAHIHMPIRIMRSEGQKCLSKWMRCDFRDTSLDNWAPDNSSSTRYPDPRCSCSRFLICVHKHEVDSIVPCAYIGLTQYHKAACSFFFLHSHIVCSERHSHHIRHTPIMWSIIDFYLLMDFRWTPNR